MSQQQESLKPTKKPSDFLKRMTVGNTLSLEQPEDLFEQLETVAELPSKRETKKNSGTFGDLKRRGSIMCSNIIPIKKGRKVEKEAEALEELEISKDFKKLRDLPNMVLHPFDLRTDQVLEIKKLFPEFKNRS